MKGKKSQFILILSACILIFAGVSVFAEPAEPQLPSNLPVYSYAFVRAYSVALERSEAGSSSLFSGAIGSIIGWNTGGRLTPYIVGEFGSIIGSGPVEGSGVTALNSLIGFGGLYRSGRFFGGIDLLVYRYSMYSSGPLDIYEAGFIGSLPGTGFSGFLGFTVPTDMFLSGRYLSLLGAIRPSVRFVPKENRVFLDGSVIFGIGG